jgi:hypothetical protein
VVLGKKDLDDVGDIITLAAWRVGMTISGVLFVVLGSAAILPTYATRRFEKGLGNAMKSGLETCVGALKDAMPDRSCLDTPARGSTMRGALAQLRPMLEEVEAEWLFVRRKVDKSKDLLCQSEAMVDAIEMCEAVANELVVMKTSSAMRWCLNCCDGRGEELTLALDECFQILSMFASDLHSFLDHSGAVQLGFTRIRTRLHKAFTLVRASAFYQGAMVELMSDGIMNFWAFIFAIENLLQECETLGVLILGETHKALDVSQGPGDVAPFVLPRAEDNLRDAAKLHSEQAGLPGALVACAS